MKRNRLFSLGLMAICMTGVLACSHTSTTVDENYLEPPSMRATLWMQTSGEYRAICEQIYQMAYEVLRGRVEREHNTWSKPPAVVMDLDETVLDNSAYQTMLLREQTYYNSETWTAWMNERWDTIGLVPGAGRFIQQCEAMGLRVVFITNRHEAERPGTIKSLRNLGINFDDMGSSAQLRLLLTDDEIGSDKTSRRRAVAEKYEIIAYFGDNLIDLSEEFAPHRFEHFSERQAAVDAQSPRLGTQWFVLPNPLYGAWQAMIPREDPMGSLR